MSLRAFDAGTAVATLQLDSTQFHFGLNQARQEANNFGNGFNGSLTAVGASMMTAGALMTKGFTVPIVDGFKSVITSAGDLEASLTNVRKTTDAEDTEYESLLQWARDLSTEIPVAASKLLDIGEIIGQMGVPLRDNREEFQKYIEIAAKLAYTTNLTEESAANFIGRFSTLMKVTGDDVDALGAALVDLGNKYNGTESEIAALSLRLTGAANIVGMSAKGVLGLSAAMVNVGLTAETGGSSMSRFIANIDEATFEGGEKLEAFAALAGVSADAFVKAWRENPEAAILNLIEGMADMQAAGGNIYDLLDTLDIGTIRYTDTIKRLIATTESSNKAMDDANAAWEKADALETEATKRKEDFNSQLEMTKNAWEDIKVTIGEVFLPVLKELMVGLREWFDTIKDKLNPETVLMVAGILAVIAVIGPLLTAIGSIVSVIGVLSGPVGWALLAIEAFGIAVYKLVEISNQADKALAEVVKGITPFEAAVSGLSPTLLDINGLLSATGKTVQDLDKAIGDSEAKITKIYADALAEHRQLRQSELDDIKNHAQHIYNLQIEKLQLHHDQQKAELLKFKLESNTITQEQAEQRIANAKYAYEQSNKVTEEAYTAELVRIENHHKVMGTIGTEAYNRDLQSAKYYYEEFNGVNKKFLADTYLAAAESADNWVEKDKEKWNDLNDWNKYSSRQYVTALTQMDLDTAEAFLSTVATARKYGAEISDETLKTADSILAAFDDLAPFMDQAGRNTFLRLIEGMKDQIPGLEDASSMSTDAIIDTIRYNLGINSPSTVMQSIGRNVSEGLAVGIENDKDGLRRRLSTWSGDVITWIKGVFGIKSPSAIMRDSVGKQLVAGIAQGITENTDLIEDAMNGLIPVVTGSNLALEMTKGLASNSGAFAPKYGYKETHTEALAGSASNVSGGNTYNFYSPKALDPVTAKRQFDTTQKQQSLLFDIG